MNYKQHKHVGDSVIVGKNVKLHLNPKAKGRIIFTQKENIAYTSAEFFNRLKKCNDSLVNLDINDFRNQVENEKLDAHVQRSFGDINAWAGDHSKIFPPDGKARKFEELKVKLQVVANTKDFDYLALALGNWDHFMPMCYKMWKRFHREALRLAKKYANDPGKQNAFVKGIDSDGKSESVVFDIATNDMAQALFLDAYACHFLEDCFAAGHLRGPRLLFGKDMDSLRSKIMHDEDNQHRLEGCNKNGEKFRLIGEDHDRDDFTTPAKLDKDKDMKILLDRAVDAIASSVQQVCDVALGKRTVKRDEYGEISGKVPQVELFWKQLDQKRSRTHSLEFRPKGARAGYPKPCYKFHANFDEDERLFEDPIILKLRSNGSWRRVLLGDVDNFTPGKGLADWVPTTPEETIIMPK
ncbi:hypothetical protein QUF75_12045 [Desulfococcaceae bacterium HSG7]|nr:hypothetical protein [Desulfococcaceae bacterium HSG7]